MNIRNCCVLGINQATAYDVIFFLSFKIAKVKSQQISNVLKNEDPGQTMSQKYPGPNELKGFNKLLSVSLSSEDSSWTSAAN